MRLSFFRRVALYLRGRLASQKRKREVVSAAEDISGAKKLRVVLAGLAIFWVIVGYCIDSL